MRYIKGNANKGYWIGHGGKKAAHKPRIWYPPSKVTSRQMTEEDWARFNENKYKKKK